MEHIEKTPLIREIASADNAALASIIRAALAEFKADKPGTVYFDPTTDHLFELFRTPQSVYWILEVDGVIMGGGGIFPTEGLPEGCCELVKLYLSPASRGKGWGKLLIEKCAASAVATGFTSLYLETLPELSNAVALYEKCGFTMLEKALGASGHFGCNIWMLKQL
ncbi:putative acetyltransferase [Filimonas lacunae]|uniref:Putative acetyltransferase n=1 Tax=Filimonas lacunae TaxID=477680 RepID=A0A173MLL2_9BACT|nr:GNAT family N-acetyltransferase [Filimonas lacunae]BAV08288.1 acetyltransferase [Filimonas lacunae]SIT33261.1 putative acetyltransferase [Filimonas lacunae]